MRSASRFTLHAARLVVIGLLVVGCASVTDAGDAPVLDLSVGNEVIGSVDAGSWCRTSMGVDTCVAADGPVSEFDVGCEADLQIDPRGEGWQLLDSNVLAEVTETGWSIGFAEGDVLIDMGAPSVEASWYFIIERPAC